MSRISKNLLLIAGISGCLLVVYALFFYSIYNQTILEYVYNASSSSGTTSPQHTKIPTVTPTPTPTKPTFGPTRDELLKTMNQTFNEEFNSLSLYTDKNGNTDCHEGGIGIWQTVYHFCSRTIFSNDEAELYIDKVFLDYLNKDKLVTTTPVPFLVSDSKLIIEARPIDPSVQKVVGSWAKYTSGLLTTQYSFSQTYGYFEIRTKLPRGKGLWPAFWLLPVDKNWPPEIDVMEAFGAANDLKEGTPTEIHYATHAIKKSESCGAWKNVGVDVTEDFHTYGVNWQPSGVTYYFDGEPYAKCPITSDFHKPFYMLVNLAVGGVGSWPGTPNATTTWPAHMLVDYVKAYQNKN